MITEEDVRTVLRRVKDPSSTSTSWTWASCTTSRSAMARTVHVEMTLRSRCPAGPEIMSTRSAPSRGWKASAESISSWCGRLLDARADGPAATSVSRRVIRRAPRGRGAEDLHLATASPPEAPPSSRASWASPARRLSIVPLGHSTPCRARAARPPRSRGLEPLHRASKDGSEDAARRAETRQVLLGTRARAIAARNASPGCPPAAPARRRSP